MQYHLADRPPVATAIAAAQAAQDLDQLYEAIASYRGHELAQTQPYSPSQRTTHHRPIMIVTEKPEPNDHVEGRPFSGDYGQLMRETLGEIGVDQEDFHIAYAIHWTPPAEKAPNKTTIAASRPFLYREIELVAPRVLIAPGRHVVEALTGYRGHITPILDQTLAYEGPGGPLQAYVTWHPAWPLRFGADRPEFTNQWRHALEQYGEERDNTIPGQRKKPRPGDPNYNFMRDGLFEGLAALNAA